MEFLSWRRASADWRKSLSREKPAGLWNQNLREPLRTRSDAPLRTADVYVSSGVTPLRERNSFQTTRWSNAQNRSIDACSRALRGKSVSFLLNGLGASTTRDCTAQ